MMAFLRSATLLISTPPEIWRPEKASSLGGVIVMPEDVTPHDVAIIKERKLPYLIFGESELPGPRILVGQREAAKKMTERLLQLGHRRFAMLTGFDKCLDAPKRAGVFEALLAAGINPSEVPDFSAHGEESDMFQAARELLKLHPRPTAVIALDDTLASLLSVQARKQEGMQIPAEMSLVSFHDWPYLNCVEPALTTVHFEFFAAGKRAAEVLSQAAQTGEPVADLEFQPTYNDGQTIGPVPGGE